MVIFHRLNQSLSGWPDSLLTVLLIITGILFVLIALLGKPLLKAGAAGLVIF